ncbi:MAG: hypothetical protein HOH36_07045 [Acidimicrobiaceae bacterium]|nr:hypothetical protein [Acidimicrobiaceae bacterium]
MTAGASSPLDRFPQMIARVGGGLLLAFGLWAMAGPRSFFDSLATFDPYNQHLIQDLGAFQIGLGVVLLVAALVSPSDGLLTGLVGVGAAMAAHAVSHAVGHDLGGTPKVDIPVFALLGGLLLGGGLVRWRQLPA